MKVCRQRENNMLEHAKRSKSECRHSILPARQDDRIVGRCLHRTRRVCVQVILSTVRCCQYSNDQMADVPKVPSRSRKIATDTICFEEPYTQSPLPGTYLVQRHRCMSCSTTTSRVWLDHGGFFVLAHHINVTTSSFCRCRTRQMWMHNKQVWHIFMFLQKAWPGLYRTVCVRVRRGVMRQ